MRLLAITGLLVALAASGCKSAKPTAPAPPQPENPLRSISVTSGSLSGDTRSAYWIIGTQDTFIVLDALRDSATLVYDTRDSLTLWTLCSIENKCALKGWIYSPQYGRPRAATYDPSLTPANLNLRFDCSNDCGPPPCCVAVTSEWGTQYGSTAWPPADPYWSNTNTWGPCGAAASQWNSLAVLNGANVKLRP